VKHTFVILTLGLVIGLGTHLAYFRLHVPAAAAGIDGQLAWMRTELQLTNTQYARIKALHEASSPKLRAMAAQVAQLQGEFKAFEQIRRTKDQVDFLEFARFVETRRHVSRECLDSTRQLVLASAEVMTPQQRQRYIRLVTTAEPLAQLLLN
jgi:small-conductance mechanosensitive channel